MNHLIAALWFGWLSIGQLPSSFEEHLDSIIKDLESKDVEDRRGAARYFQFMVTSHSAVKPEPKKAIPALLKALNDVDPEVRQCIASTFAWYGQDSKPAVPLLADLLSDKEVKVRRTAAGTLLHLGALSKGTLPALIEAKKDSDKFVRINSGAAVARLEEENEKALRFLLEFANDEDEEVRGAASKVFVYIGVRAIPILKDGLKDKNPVARAWTIGAFIAIMRKDSERAKFPADAIPLLINAINDENTHVATAAIYAVSQLGVEAKDAVPVIVKRFKDPDWQVRQYAIRHVVEFGPAAELAIPALKDALKDEHERVREEAERSLAAIEKAKKAKTP
jgi:HEAT repeat protein